MTWRRSGDAIELDGNGVVLTSTCTRLVFDSVGPFSARKLVMFGPDGRLFDAIDPWKYQERIAPASPYVHRGFVTPDPVADPGVEPWPYVGFIESRTVAAGLESWFESAPFSLSSASAPFVRNTTIPGVKRRVPTLLPYEQYTPAGPAHPGTTTTVEYDIQYKDPSVVDLPDGRGRIMLLGRLRSLPDDREKNEDGTPKAGSGPTTRPDRTFADIVGFWAPDDDPTFSGEEVAGPFWFVNAMDAIPGLERVRMWLGVPTGAVASDEAGTQALYVYYAAEEAEYLKKSAWDNISTDAEYLDRYWRLLDAADYQRGIYVRRIELDDLYTHLRHKKHVRSESRIPVDYTDERTWLEDPAGPEVVTGTNLGRVRLWMDMGAEIGQGPGMAWREQLQPTDPAAAVCEGSLYLYFAAHPLMQDIDHLLEWPPQGVWRSTALKGATHDFGRDFVVSIVGDRELRLDAHFHDQIVADYPEMVQSKISIGGGTPSPGPARVLWATYADPDPVALGNGTWLVFIGGVGPLQRFVGDEESACSPSLTPFFRPAVPANAYAIRADRDIGLTEGEQNMQSPGSRREG